MNADSTFMIGATHAVCQDYAIARNASNASHVILSDGCSTSPDTDIGARLMVRAAAQRVLNATGVDCPALHNDATSQALQWAQSLGLALESVDATLLTAHCNGEELIVGASGDGVIILESTSGALDVYSVSYPSGFPLYPAYAHQQARLAAWQSNDRACKEVNHFQAGSIYEPLELVETSIDANMTNVLRVRASDYKDVVIISDGVHSFYKTQETSTSRQLHSIAVDQVLQELVSFKGGNGAFVARRAKKLMRSWASKDWHHADDLAVGAIYLGE